MVSQATLPDCQHYLLAELATDKTAGLAAIRGSGTRATREEYRGTLMRVPGLVTGCVCGMPIQPARRDLLPSLCLCTSHQETSDENSRREMRDVHAELQHKHHHHHQHHQHHHPRSVMR